MTREKQIEILIEDRCTKADAEKALKRGTVIFEDFEEHFDDYMKEWECDEEEIERFREMIQKKDPVTGWGIVDMEGHNYYIAYVN